MYTCIYYIHYIHYVTDVYMNACIQVNRKLHEEYLADKRLKETAELEAMAIQASSGAAQAAVYLTSPLTSPLPHIPPTDTIPPTAIQTGR